MTSGIYAIWCKITNRVYVGLSISIYTRLRSHRNCLKRGLHNIELLQDDFDLYGIESFEFGILEECVEDIMYERENYWISLFNSNNPIFGYNINQSNFSTQRIKEPLNKIDFSVILERQKERKS